jgi:hypothetical protein
MLSWNGYGRFSTHKDGKKKRTAAHRAAFEFTGGTIPKGHLVCHHCDNRKCCNPNHLYAGTSTQNNRDTVLRKRNVTLVGEMHPNSKLTKELVFEIRQRSKDGESAHSIGRSLNIHNVHVGRIIRRERWRHI